MKKRLHKLLTLALIISVSSIFSLQAQTILPSASMDANMAIKLDEKAPLSTEYVIDISKMNFKDEESAKQFFRSMTDNLVQCDLNYSDKKATLRLAVQYTSGKNWGVPEWNNYFSSTAARYRSNFNRVNQ